MAAGPGTRLHRIWKGMKARCSSPSTSGFKQYGGRGIKVCAEWTTFVGFLDWALSNGYDQHLQLDRRDPTKDYSPGNCRWVTGRFNASRAGVPLIEDGDGRLSVGDVESADARAKPYKIHDGQGLYLHVGSGGAKSWRYKYRFGGKERVLTFGRFPVISIVEARGLRDIARVKLGSGRDPGTIRKASEERRVRRQRAKVGV